jgi:hypothetical protein
MKVVDERYGPLEWRLPEAHAIYWAARGFEMARLNPTKIKSEDLIQLGRAIFQSMQLSFRRGRLVSNPFQQGIETGPNLAIIPKANAAYEEQLKDRGNQYRMNIEGAHRNFLRDAVIFLYSAGRVADATSWYNYLVEKYPDKPLIENDPTSFPRNITLNQFVVAQIMIDVGETDRDKVKARIEEFVGGAYLFLVRGENELYAGYRLMARDLWASYMEKIRGGGSAGEIRIGLPPVEETEKEMLKRMLDPEEGLPPEMRAILRTELQLGPEPITAPANGSGTSTNTPSATTNAAPVAPGK